MKHAIRLALLLTLAPLALRAQEAPDDRYIAIYDLIQTADTALEQNNSADARAKYTEAQTSLKKFAVDFPNWNTKIVNFRLNYLDTKLGTTTARVESAKPTAKNSNELQAVDSDRELADLQNKLRTAQTERAALEKKLANTPTAQALTDAQTQVRQLADENKSLKAAAGKTAPGSHSVDASTLDRITQDLAGAKAKLEEQNKAIAVLTSEKELLQKRVEAVSTDDGKGSATAAQLTTLQAQLNKVIAEKTVLADQLKTVQATTVDAAKFARTEAAVKELQRENNLLRASVEKGQSGALQFTNTTAISELQRSLADLTAKLDTQTALVAKLNGEKSELQKQMDVLAAAGSSNRELVTTKKNLTALKRKFDIQTEAAVILISEANLKMAKLSRSNATLTTQNSTLKKQLSSLASTTKFVVEGLKSENENLRTAAKSAKPAAALAANDASSDFNKLEEQLAMLRAKVTVLEAQPVAYSAEELALFRKPETASLAKIPADKADKKLPASANDLIAEAQRAFAKQDFELARTKYLDVLKLDDKSVYTLGNLATIELEMDKLDDAEKHLQTALALKPKDAFCLGALGNLRFRQGKYDAALDALSSAAQINPNDAEIQNFLGVTLSQKGQRAAAEAALRKAIQLDPQYGSAHNNLAVIYLTQTPPQIELARWHYQKALAAGQPRNAELEKMMDDAGKTPEPKP
ncbi:MAG: repeat containing protein [Verrucomicrobiota bacterium]|jgi:Tfp pilus assembly protein PilF